MAGGCHLSEVEKFLRDQNDQTERKKETEKRRRQERLPVPVYYVVIFGKLGSTDTFLRNKAEF